MIALASLVFALATMTTQSAPGVSDVPATAVAEKKREVAVTVRLEVDEKGSVAKCEVVDTDAPKELADTVCPIFSTKAKFTPAVDSNGSPQAATVTQTVKFVVKD